MKAFFNYLKRNAVFLLIAFTIVAIGLSATIMILEKQNNGSIEASTNVNDNTGNNDEGKKENTDEPITNSIVFISPVENAVSTLDYSETMVYNSTMNRFSSHKAIDYFAEEGAQVLAVFGGKIESIENTLIYGTTITIDHGNGLKTIYNSIEENDDIFVGQTISAGAVIGTISTTNRQEYKSGAHLHFEVTENGEVINPSKYMVEIQK